MSTDDDDDDDDYERGVEVTVLECFNTQELWVPLFELPCAVPHNYCSFVGFISVPALC
jgi:hypothetical protein